MSSIGELPPRGCSALRSMAGKLKMGSRSVLAGDPRQSFAKLAEDLAKVRAFCPCHLLPRNLLGDIKKKAKRRDRHSALSTEKFLHPRREATPTPALHGGAAMFSATTSSASSVIVPSVGGITKTSTALSTEEWSKLEESAERIQKSIAGSLKTILNEVQDAIGNTSANSQGTSGDGSAVAEAGADEANRCESPRRASQTIRSRWPGCARAIRLFRHEYASLLRSADCADSHAHVHAGRARRGAARRRCRLFGRWRGSAKPRTRSSLHACGRARPLTSAQKYSASARRY